MPLTITVSSLIGFSQTANRLLRQLFVNNRDDRSSQKEQPKRKRLCALREKQPKKVAGPLPSGCRSSRSERPTREATTSVQREVVRRHRTPLHISESMKMAVADTTSDIFTARAANLPSWEAPSWVFLKPRR